MTKHFAIILITTGIFFGNGIGAKATQASSNSPQLLTQPISEQDVRECLDNATKPPLNEIYNIGNKIDKILIHNSIKRTDSFAVAWTSTNKLDTLVIVVKTDGKTNITETTSTSRSMERIKDVTLVGNNLRVVSDLVSSPGLLSLGKFTVKNGRFEQ